MTPTYVQGCTKRGGQGGQLPPQILADQKAPPGSGGAPHYYLPPWIFDPWCIPALDWVGSEIDHFGLLTEQRGLVGGLENHPKHAYVIFEWSRY